MAFFPAVSRLDSLVAHVSPLRPWLCFAPDTHFPVDLAILSGGNKVNPLHLTT